MSQSGASRVETFEARSPSRVFSAAAISRSQSGGPAAMIRWPSARSSDSALMCSSAALYSGTPYRSAMSCRNRTAKACGVSIGGRWPQSGMTWSVDPGARACISRDKASGVTRSS